MLLSILLLKYTNLKVSHDYSIKTMNFIKLTNIVINPSKIITIYMTIYTNEISTTQTNKLIITNKINDIIYMYRNSYIYFHKL